MSSSELLGIRTRTVAELSAADVDDDFVAVFASDGPEDRSVLAVWNERLLRIPERCAVVKASTWDSVQISINNEPVSVLLHDLDELRRSLGKTEAACIDITGLAHHIWAPMVRAALASCKRVRVVYAEPAEYRRHSSPASPSIFDLSSGFRGLYPLPTFARLSPPEIGRPTVFVALLGFEGMRPRHLAANLDPEPTVFPVVGVPGFQIELPTHTVACNREFLRNTRSYASIRWARASSPFAAYDAIEDVTRDVPGAYLYLAPVGTKPHALGAVMYAIDHPDDVELMYDHPQRSPGRSKGIGSTHMYYLK